ncbi:MAG: SH3 domain-containing protein [Chryseolinea sp.]
MKNGLLITSVLALLIFCSTTSRAQSTVGHMPSSKAGEMAKCVGSSDCTACKNCSSCAHCKEEGGKCGVCKKIASHQASAKEEEDYTKVEWSAKSLKPAATTLQSLDVHSGPGESFKVVGKVSNHDPLIIIGEREGWYKIVVSHADLVGFVEVSHVSIVQ